MPTEQIVALLITQRDRLNRAIEALQSPVKRRGRPPKGLMATSANAKPERTRKGRTAAQRRAQSEKMKAYWAQQRNKVERLTGLR